MTGTRRWVRPNLRELTWVLLAAGALWRCLRYALGFPLWGDEAFVGVNFFVRDFAGLIRPLEWGQIVPLLFSWITLAATRVAGVNEYTLRLVSLAAGLAALFLFARLASRLLPGRAALLATAFLAVSYYAVRHGAEVKPYALDLLVSVSLTSLGWAVHERPTWRWGWAALVMLTAASVWSSYPSVFVAAAVAGVLALRVAGPGAAAAGAVVARVGVVGVALALAVSFGWMYAVYGRPHALHAARLTEIPMWAPFFPPLTEPLKLPLWLAYVHTGPMMAYPHGGNPPGSVATLLLFLVGAVHLGRRRPRLLLLLLGPFVFNFAAAAMKAYPYGGSARTSLFLAPAICLLAGVGLWRVLVRFLPRPHPGNAVVMVGCGLLALPLAGMIGDVRKPYQSIESQRGYDAVRDVARRTGASDRWIVFNAVEPCEYAPYLGDWHGTGGQFVFDVMRFAPVPLSWAPRPEEVEVPRGGRVWLLAMRGVRVDFPEAQFAAYLSRLKARFGEASHERTLLKSRDGRDEAIDVYGFAAR